MRVLIFRVSLFILALCFATSAGACPQVDDEAVALSNRFVSDYDSLIKGYVMQRYAQQLNENENENENKTKTKALKRTSAQAVSDSVIARRLRAMHTVVPMSFNNIVRSHIDMYLARMESRLDVMLMLSDFYSPVFEEALARYDVPEEIKYLTIVESAMNPEATSRKGAAGLWQFMYGTGKMYGLEVNSVIDERRDTYKSSDAAAHHLHDLHGIYHDWLLAIAAYNCGAGNVNKAIARSGGKHSFWEIYPHLPRETRGYVPAFIAVSYVMTYYPEHGMHPTKISIPLRTDTVVIENNLLFCFVSKHIGIGTDELHALNPQYRIGFVPGNEGAYPLCLPTDKVSQFISWADTIFAETADSLSRDGMKAITEVGGAKNSSPGLGMYHKVRKGETLSAIASRHGTSVKRLKKLNNLKTDKIHVGQRLRVR